MGKIKTADEAISLFSEFSRRHGQAMVDGKSKEANKFFRLKMECIEYLFEHHSLGRLAVFLDDDSIPVRASVAYALLPVMEKESVAVLSAISGGDYNIYSLNAFYTLAEWKKGNLRFPYQDGFGK